MCTSIYVSMCILFKCCIHYVNWDNIDVSSNEVTHEEQVFVAIHESQSLIKGSWFLSNYHIHQLTFNMKTEWIGLFPSINNNFELNHAIEMISSQFSTKNKMNNYATGIFFLCMHFKTMKYFKTIKINKDEQYTSLSIHKQDTLRCKSIYTPIVMISLL